MTATPMRQDAAGNAGRPLIVASTADKGELRIPDALPNDVLGAALAYAAAGWFVLPIDSTTKHAGSVLGVGWPSKTSRDPQQIAAWFAGSRYGLALHVGRSGAIAFDVDEPGAVPDWMRSLLVAPPFQSSRSNVPGRGAFVFAQPPGRTLGNSLGDLPKGWGDVRGLNGIIIVEPTSHSKASEGGCYRWLRQGALPVLPADLSLALPDAFASGDSVTTAHGRQWFEDHKDQTGTRPDGAQAILDRYRRESAGGRHTALVGCLVWAAKEIEAGLLGVGVLRDLQQLHERACAGETL